MSRSKLVLWSWIEELILGPNFSATQGFTQKILIWIGKKSFRLRKEQCSAWLSFDCMKYLLWNKSIHQIKLRTVKYKDISTRFIADLYYWSGKSHQFRFWKGCVDKIENVPTKLFLGITIMLIWRIPILSS